MQVKSGLAVFAVTLGFVIPKPIAIETREQSQTPDGYFIACTGVAFVGECHNFPFVSSQCRDFSPAFNNSISSVVPAPGWECILWQDPSCYGDVYASVYPGVPFLNSTDFDNAASSYVCHIAITDLP